VQRSRSDLERALLDNPFDRALRLDYAALLAESGEPEQALKQYELLAGQPDPPSQATVGAARCLLALGQKDAALARYQDAKRLPGFEPEAALEALLAERRRAEPVKISVIPGKADVIPIDRAYRDKIRFADIAGMDDLKKTIRLQIIEPFLRPGLFAKFRKRAGGGILLYGPPGCGKTMMARAVATECRASFLAIGISDVMSMWTGESERNLGALFEKARSEKPCVLFFDELDALAFARSKASSEHSRKIVNEFLAQLDGFDSENSEVLVLAATNMPWDVDAAMKRPGRFARQVFVPPPDEAARAHIIELNLKDVPHDAVDGGAIALATQHFSGADIAELIERAKELVIADHIAGQTERVVTQADLESAAANLKPSTLDWLRTARNLVKYAGADDTYVDVDRYLKRFKLL